MFAKEARSGKEHRHLSETDKLSTISDKEISIIYLHLDIE
jgi:hypothetical protein